MVAATAIRVNYRACAGVSDDMGAADANRNVAAIINYSNQVYVESSAISRWTTLGLGWFNRRKMLRYQRETHGLEYNGIRSW